MSFLSARDFTLVMLAIVFFAGAVSIGLLTPLPSAANVWAAAGFSAAALVMLVLAFFPHRPGKNCQTTPGNESAGRPTA